MIQGYRIVINDGNHLEPAIGLHDWRADAACRNTDPRVFFANGKGSTFDKRAKALCGVCPVIEECRAMNDRAEGKSHVSTLAGIYAGETPRERYRRRRREREAARAEGVA